MFFFVWVFLFKNHKFSFNFELKFKIKIDITKVEKVYKELFKDRNKNHNIKIYLQKIEKKIIVSVSLCFIFHRHKH